MIPTNPFLPQIPDRRRPRIVEGPADAQRNFPGWGPRI
jgi:hypothetical protein